MRDNLDFSMNLSEVCRLIEFIPSDDKQMLDFYTDRRDKLVESINRELGKKGYPAPYSLKDLLSIHYGVGTNEKHSC